MKIILTIILIWSLISLIRKAKKERMFSVDFLLFIILCIIGLIISFAGG